MPVSVGKQLFSVHILTRQRRNTKQEIHAAANIDSALANNLKFYRHAINPNKG